MKVEAAAEVIRPMAAERIPHQSITARSTDPLFAVIFEEGGEEMVRYFIDSDAAPATEPSADAQAALSAIGAWSDLDWDELAESLDRIRHESTPTPPIDEL